MAGTLQIIAPDRRMHGEAMIDLLSKVFSINGGYFGTRAWCTDTYIYNSHYDWQASRIGIIDDVIVSHYGIWDYQMRIGTARVRSGGVGIVSTHGEYRKMGLMAKTAMASVEAMRALGYEMSLLFGIENFYHRFGYVRAWGEGTWIVDVNDLPAEAPQVKVRKFNLKHQQALADLYNAENATATGTAVRPTYSKCGNPGKWQGLLWLGENGQPAGYIVFDKWGRTLQYHDGAGDVETRLRLLARLARKEGCHEVKFFSQPRNSALIRRVRQGNCKVDMWYRKNGSAMVCLLNLPATMGKLTGELSLRLQRSALADWTGDLRLADARDAITLRIAGGQVQAVAPVDTPHTVTAGNEMAQYVIGTESPDEIAEMAGTRMTGDAARLIEALFPAQHPMLSQWDHF